MGVMPCLCPRCRMSNESTAHQPVKTIVMTGATTGIGLAAAHRLRGENVRLMIGARSGALGGVSLALDLASLSSVRSFADAVTTQLGNANIDGLVFNAGMQTGSINARTEDGLETTFATNHLAHYLLLRLLMPRLAHGATVVITTSDLHDPRTNSIAPPEHADAALLARGQTKLHSSRDVMAVMRAYAASKLCNVLTAHALSTSAFAQARGLHVIAFNPGLTPGTGLIRSQPRVFKLLFRLVVSMLGPLLRMNTIAGGGDLLAALVLGRNTPPAGRIYASQSKRTLSWPDPSAMATADVVATKLWRDSAAMLGLPDSP